MTLIPRTATIQARVFPSVKEASEQILWRIGLNMSEAMELFLRRVIVDECIPFEVVALDAAILNPAATTMGKSQESSQTTPISGLGRGSKKKISKSFLRGSTSASKQLRKEGRKRSN